MQRWYIAVDLKSFYASVEAMDLHLDPLTTNLVVADASRTEKTICLAVSPSLKAYGIPGRARLFEVIQKVRQANAFRRQKAPGRRFTHKSSSAEELARDPSAEIDFIIAPPRMAHYIQYSTRIYSIYMRYIAPEDIHVYSIDEILADVTGYLDTYCLSAHDLAMKMIRDVLQETGITATAGIGTNLYLAKIAMDIVAKHVEPDKNGVRIAELDEMEYRRKLWSHRPLKDFWRVGSGYSRKLEANGLFTMGDIARCSIQNEDLLYDLFGKNAELLIDHAWGWEPCTMDLIKAYKPETSSFSSGQVLQEPYPADRARVVIYEMADAVSLDLVEKGLVTDQLVLTVNYDILNLKNGTDYSGEISTDYYGRKVPKHAHGTINLKKKTSSSRLIVDAVLNLYDRIVDKNLLVRRMNLTVNRVVPESEAAEEPEYEQMDLFTDYAALAKEQEKEKAELEKERLMQKTLLDLRKKFGKNAVLKGINFEEGATGRERNRQIGGHQA